MNKISFSRFRNSDYVVLVVKIIGILSKYGSEVLSALGLQELLTGLINRQTYISLALDKNRKNPYTDLIADCDDKRDDALDAFKYFLLYCTKQASMGIREAAEDLIDSIKTFGWSMQDEGNSEQSKQVKSFIADVENKTNLSEAIATCNCLSLFELIKSTQVNFDDAMEKFNTAETHIREIDPSVEKAWVRDTIDSMLLEVNYHKRKGTMDEVNAIANEMDTMFESIGSELKSRQTRAKSKVDASNGQ